MLPLLLVISLDAFMYQYFNVSKLHLPNFDYLQRRGVLAPLEPHFTSKTFPNHWSYVTGLYEDASNIVDNYMYDPKLGFFSFQSANSSQMAEWLTSRYTGEPIWMSNEKNVAQQRKSGVYMWPGTLAADSLPKIRSRYMMHYNNSEAFDFKKGIDTAIDWMATKDVNFAMIYHPEPDTLSHQHGPFSEEVMNIVTSIDNDLGYLIRKLKSTADLWPRINIIICSDHGMTTIDHVIDVRAIRDDAEVVIDNAAVLQIQPKPDKTEAVLTTLRSMKNFKVYLKEELPERYHYLHSERILPIVAVADEGYAFEMSDKPYPIIGQHGFDPAYESMHGIFLGSGPSFKSSEIRKKAILPIDAYAIMVHILGVTVPPHNGSLSRVEDMLLLDYFDVYARKLLETVGVSSSSSVADKFSATSVAVVAVIVACAVVISLVFIVRILCNRRYTILNIRGERGGLMPLQSLRGNGNKSYNDKGNAPSAGHYSLLLTPPNEVF